MKDNHSYILFLSCQPQLIGLRENYCKQKWFPMDERVNKIILGPIIIVVCQWKMFWTKV